VVVEGGRVAGARRAYDLAQADRLDPVRGEQFLGRRDQAISRIEDAGHSRNRNKCIDK
jgi:hypothetical protein